VLDFVQRVANESVAEGIAMGHELTTVKKILVAASHLDEERENFTAEDLVVRAWREFPESFGLNGYRESFPDANRVLSKLMGSVGMCSRGWLEQVSTKTYRLTQTGRQVAHGLKRAPASNDDGRILRSPRRAATKAVPRARVAAADSRVTGPSRLSNEEAHAPGTNVPNATSSLGTERSSGLPGRASVPPATTHGGPNAPQQGLSTTGSGALTSTSNSLDTRGANRSKPSVTGRVRGAQGSASGGSNETETAQGKSPSIRPGQGATSAAPSSLPPAPTVAPLHPVLLQSLFRCVSSAAFQKFTRGGMISFADASGFWGIAGLRGTRIQERLDDFRKLCDQVDEQIRATNATLRVFDRIDVTLSTVTSLRGLDQMLRTRYQRDLEQLAPGFTSK